LRTSGNELPSACLAAISIGQRPVLLPAMDSADVAILSNSFCPGSMASISLLMGSPLTIMFSAASTPSTRGRRCVPPAPGISPI
jgi:hypothetical protein